MQVMNIEPRLVTIHSPIPAKKGQPKRVARLDLAPLQVGEVGEQFVENLTPAGKILFDRLVSPTSPLAKHARDQMHSDQMRAAQNETKALLPKGEIVFGVARPRIGVPGAQNFGPAVGPATIGGRPAAEVLHQVAEQSAAESAEAAREITGEG